jgi:ornithine--oxo-acid transaminase
VLTDEAVLGLLRPGDHGSTFGGNPLGAAIARSALRVIVDEDLTERARSNGAYFKGRLQRIESEHVSEVRGKGLLLGVELNKPARAFAVDLYKHGILAKETHGTVLRFAPPLIITRDEIDWAVERIEGVLLNGKGN